MGCQKRLIPIVPTQMTATLNLDTRDNTRVDERPAVPSFQGDSQVIANNGIAVYTVEGDACVFPFVYRGLSYDECIKSSHDASWCSTTSNYDYDKKWGMCKKEQPVLMFSDNSQVGHSGMTYGGNANLKNCVFPFQYNGETHYKCIDSSPTKSWCSVTDDYGRDKMWGFCVKATCDLDRVIEDDCRQKDQTDSCGRMMQEGIEQCRTCGYCHKCHDESTRCADIASRGQCEAEKEFTSVNCHLSCGHC